MKISYLAVLLCGFFGACIFVGARQTTGKKAASVEQIITQLELDFSDAEVKADILRMSELLADDMTDIEDDGSTNTKAGIITLFQSPTTKLASDMLAEIRVRVYGDTAVVTMLDTAEFTVDGKDMGGVFRLTDVWVKRGGKWQLVALHSSKIKK